MPATPSNAPLINTRPNRPEPPPALVYAAECDLPGAMADLEDDTGAISQPGQRAVSYSRLRQALAREKHSLASAEWAIHRHVEAGRLTAEPTPTSLPAALLPDGRWVTFGEGLRCGREECRLHSTPSLWEWWRSRHQAHVSPPSQTPSPDPTPDPFRETLGMYRRLYQLASDARDNRSVSREVVDQLVGAWAELERRVRAEAARLILPLAAVDRCLTEVTRCVRYFGWVAKGDPVQWWPLHEVAPFVEEQLTQLVNLADQKCVPVSPRAGVASAPPGDAVNAHQDSETELSETARAAIRFIRGKRGEGVGAKAILAALKKEGIDMAEATFRRHIVPELKAAGVKNHRSRGGYYLDEK